MKSVGDLLSHSGWAVLYLGVVTTALCHWVQTLGQREVGAEQAVLIFALDPVWGAFFARMILQEGLGPQGLVGGALIITAAAASQLLAPGGRLGPKALVPRKLSRALRRASAEREERAGKRPRAP